jgi:signal transduction histidine kinase
MTDQFDKDTIRQFGARGSPVFSSEKTSTDLEELTERVERLNGTMKIRSAPEEGTQISALLPLRFSEELD